MNIGELCLSVNLVDVMGNLEGLANTLYSREQEFAHDRVA
jgi:hypothetical protein